MPFFFLRVGLLVGVGVGVELRVGAFEAVRERTARARVGVASSEDVATGAVTATAVGVLRLRLCRGGDGAAGAAGLVIAAVVAEAAGAGVGFFLRLLDKRTYDMAEMAERGSSASASASGSAVDRTRVGPGPGTVGPGESGCRFVLSESDEAAVVEGVLLVGERMARRFFWVLGTNRPVCAHAQRPQEQSKTRVVYWEVNDTTRVTQTLDDQRKAR
jgi:hypothetical protein